MAESEAAAAAAVVGDAAAVAEKKDAISAADRESARQTFVTSIGAEANHSRHRDKYKYKALESTSAGPRIKENHENLTNFSETMKQRMEKLLFEHEKDFFLAYKMHMYGVQRDIKSLRMKADAEDQKTREDTKIKALEAELDWFMTEALRLDELCKGYKMEVDQWKSKTDALDEDRRFLEDQIKGSKRQNKILQAAAERARSSACTALMVTKAQTEAHDRSLTTPTGGGTMALTALPPSRPASAEGYAAGSGMNGRRAVQAQRSISAAQLTTVPASASTAILQQGGAGGAATMGAAQPQGYPSSPSRSVGGRPSTEAEERYIEAISHLKESIAREQNTIRRLQAARATSYSKKSELEEFFLKCIDEARKEVMKKKHMTKQKDKGERERVLEAMLSNEDVLVCLYEKLFPHRTGIARSLGGNNDAASASTLKQTQMAGG